MNAPIDLKMTKAEFLRWVEGQEGRYELKDGRVVLQAGVSRNHYLVRARYLIALAQRFDTERWNVGTAVFAVEIGDDIRYPDVFVESAGGDGNARSTSQAVLLIEVLSPSSVGTDMTVKLAEYTSLPTLLAYIVASQEEPIVWVWLRGAADGDRPGAFPAKPVEIAGRERSIDVPAIALSISLAEIYRGIGQT
ncbi:MAG: Uma2 family endonuclease [Hyphomicrobiaceae bacterium]|nr:Uma2 family endonuclease [Hyphomicrobiaceae bacterium]